MVLVTIVSLSACSLTPDKTEPSKIPQSAEPTEASPSPSASLSTPESATALFLEGDPSAANISKYLSYNASHFSAEDGDLLLERLLLEQLDIALYMNSKILDDAYMTTLNQTLGGVLDVSKIPNIINDAVRHDFKMASDSLMTIVRYEETPVFEPDWAALELMKASFSTQAGVMIDYQSRLQGRYYYSDDLYNFNLLAADIAAVEQAIKNTDGGFVRWQLEHVYSVQMGRLLYGPEGSYLSMFITGDKKIVSNIAKFAGQYTDSKLGIVCKGLIKKQSEGQQAVTDFISDSLIFPPGDTREITNFNTDYNGAKLEILQVTGMQDNAVMEKINAAIMDTAKTLVKSGIADQKVNCYIGFTNDKYMNLTFSYSYTVDKKSDHYAESYLMLDVKTGARVSLNDLTGQPFKAYKAQLLEAVNKTNVSNGTDILMDLKEPVIFALDRSAMIISVTSDASQYPDSYTVTWNGLRSIMDITQLY